jgi:hypothetical protein
MLSYVDSTDANISNISSWYEGPNKTTASHSGTISLVLHGTTTQTNTEYEDGDSEPYDTITFEDGYSLKSAPRVEVGSAGLTIERIDSRGSTVEKSSEWNTFSTLDTGGEYTYSSAGTTEAVTVTGEEPFTGTTTTRVTESGSSNYGGTSASSSAEAQRNTAQTVQNFTERVGVVGSEYAADTSSNDYAYLGSTEQGGHTESSSSTGDSFSTSTSANLDNTGFTFSENSYTYFTTAGTNASTQLESTADTTVLSNKFVPTSQDATSLALDTTTKLTFEGFPSTLLAETTASLKITYTFKSLGLSTYAIDYITTSGTLTNTSYVMASYSAEGTQFQPAVPIRAKRIAFVQNGVPGGACGHIIEHKHKPKNFTHYVYSKYTDFTNGVSSTNFSLEITPNIYRKSIGFTNVTYSSHTTTANGASGTYLVTENIYNGVTEDPVLSNNYLSYSTAFGDFTSTYSEHSKYVECTGTTTTTYAQSYTATYTELSAYTRTVKTSYDFESYVLTLTLGSTSTRKTYSYQIYKATEFTRVLPQFVEILHQITTPVSSTESNEDWAATTLYTDAVSEEASKSAFTEAAIFAELSGGPFYYRPGVNGCMYEDFPHAYAGFIVGTFSAETIKKFYLTTKSQVISGTVPRSFKIDNLDYVFLANRSRQNSAGPYMGLRGFTKNYVPPEDGHYPYTYYDTETRTARSLASFSTSVNKVGSYTVTDVNSVVSTQFGSTTTTCNTTISNLNTYSYTLLDTIIRTELGYSDIKFRNGVQTSAIIIAAFTKTGGTYPTTSSRPMNAPNITETLLMGNGQTRSTILTNTQQDVYTTTSSDVSRIQETTAKIKVYVDGILPDKFVSVQPVLGTFAGGYNPKGGNYSIYLNENCITVTVVNGTNSRKWSTSALTNATFTVKNGDYFAVSAEPIYRQSINSTRTLPDFGSFATQLAR